MMKNRRSADFYESAYLRFFTCSETGLAGFEPTITESKSIALPLGYSPSNVNIVCAEEDALCIGNIYFSKKQEVAH